MKPHWRFFPVVGKLPALEGDWRKHSTSNPEQLAAWRAAGYGLALDCGSSGVFVIDVDPGGVLPEAIGPTYARKTPRGGWHYLFEGDGPSTVSKLAHHVDTRGAGGYIVFEGEGYETVNDQPLTPVPSWVLERVQAQREGKAAVDGADAAHNLERAAAWLAQQPPAIEGEGGDARTYHTVAGLFDLCQVEPEDALTLLAPWNARCVPPWSEEELTQKIENALAYRQNDVGAWAQPPHGERFASATFDRGSTTVGRLPQFYAYSVSEQDDMTVPRMVVPDFLPDQALTMLYGAPGSLKSFLALDFALTLASGRPGWGYQGEEVDVVFAAGEGPRSIARQRRPAWESDRGLDGVDYPFHLVTRVPRAAMVGEVEAFIEQIKGQGIRPKVVILDTLARFMEGLNENDVKDVSTALNCLEAIRDAFGCAVLVVHHTGYVGGGERPRGSSALPGGFDTLHEVVRPDRERTLVSVRNRLQKDSEERAEPWCFEGHRVLSSLVFRPITPGEFADRGKQHQDDGLGDKRLAAVLRELGAIGVENGIATRALSTTLYQAAENEDPGITLAKLGELDAKLKARAKKGSHLAETVGGRLLWFTP